MFDFFNFFCSKLEKLLVFTFYYVYPRKYSFRFRFGFIKITEFWPNLFFKNYRNFQFLRLLIITRALKNNRVNFGSAEAKKQKTIELWPNISLNLFPQKFLKCLVFNFILFLLIISWTPRKASLTALRVSVYGCFCDISLNYSFTLLPSDFRMFGHLLRQCPEVGVSDGIRRETAHNFASLRLINTCLHITNYCAPRLTPIDYRLYIKQKYRLYIRFKDPHYIHRIF